MCIDPALLYAIINLSYLYYTQKEKVFLRKKRLIFFFFYNCAMNNKIWNAISKDKKRGHFSPYIIIIMNFFIFWFAILCLLIIKEFPLDVIFFLLFLVMLFCLFCFFLLGIVGKMFSDVHIGRERLDADCRLAQRFLRHEQLIYFPLLFFCVCLFCCA